MHKCESMGPLILEGAMVGRPYSEEYRRRVHFSPVGADPHVASQVWSNSGALTVSAG
ncbi:hypothetical protein MPL1032_270080 [Mesorhizobium plurifarium]|uniref:Uncharacterized protein n=1 Tax=Mesorhizobium plurifarium TaxID=69974 RepID=A0A0K2W1Y8_MESPL|nr:hypothetical protein MPL1032_270080 [Mesorhizobium plurifarium]